MKKVVLLIFSGITYAVSAQMTFKTIYGTPLCEAPVAVVNTSAGGYAIGGFTTAFSNSMNFQMVVTDAVGDTVRTHEYDSGGDDYLQDMIHTSDGGYLLTGFTITSTPAFQLDLLAMKVDVNGNVMWMNKYAFTSGVYTYPTQVIQTSDGGYAFSGYYAAPAGMQSAFVLKTDGGGVQLWMNEYAIAGTSFNRNHCIVEMSNSDLVVAGTCSPTSLPSLMISRLTAAGSVVWCHKYDAYAPFVPVSMATNSTGNIFIGGTLDPYNQITNSAMMVMQVSPVGFIQWSDQYFVQSEVSSQLSGMKLSTSGDLVVVGQTMLGHAQGIVYTLGAIGMPSNAINYTDSLTYTYVDVVDGSDGGYAILSNMDYAFGVHDTSSYLLIKTRDSLLSHCDVNSYGINFFFVNFNDSVKTMVVVPGGSTSALSATESAGLSVLPVCALVGIDAMETESSVLIYPNPASTQFVVHSGDASARGNRFTLYNSLGEVVMEVQLTNRDETINCDQFPAGVYFYRMEGENELLSSGKLIVE